MSLNCMNPLECEARHKGKVDKLWQKHLEYSQRQKLLQAGNNPNQLKL
jgi:hypothetical protein